MNKVTVIIEAEHDGVQHRTEESGQFPAGDFTREQVLDVFQAALCGAGYVCEALAAEPEGDA
jgi:hypothetical protein